jgi:type VI protein secretion system component Hcp
MQNTMRTDQKTNAASQTETADEPLSEGNLEKVCGGVTKTTDKASPSLFLHCCTGRHLS